MKTEMLDKLEDDLGRLKEENAGMQQQIEEGEEKIRVSGHAGKILEKSCYYYFSKMGFWSCFFLNRKAVGKFGDFSVQYNPLKNHIDLVLQLLIFSGTRLQGVFSIEVLIAKK